MPDPGYPHEIEYRHERARGYREHVYTERVDDMGFCLEHHKDRREAWLARYTGACAEDYFRRVRPRRGTWVVSVYRLLESDRMHLVTIRMTWPARKSGDHPSEKPAPGRR
ncbi:hypothetical protein [Amycolatopsis cihanbeyliensis]|uniref:Uncharacterized protein n=1 Tax=Amycolatopsis cihanbeyliensis TaxID=1128664 RepID=A0A542DLN2_AMYCI|nr:hypothetical protein [Amycolatopsis cihanbeyliensis]TQJ04011.1 hypothetical protein FB471_3788 [Amycolatopsis cihanbeyliensis]